MVPALRSGKILPQPTGSSRFAAASRTVSADHRSEIFGDYLRYIFRSFGGGESLDDISLLVDQKLLEVPCDLGAVAITRLFRFEPLVERGGTITVDLDLVEHREGDTEFRGDELEDVGIGAGLLLGELVTRKPENAEAVSVLVKRTQTCVLRGEASIARDVDDQTDFTLELIEGNLVAGDRGHLEFVED